MPKKQLSAQEQFHLRQALHIATLSAMLSAQRWSPKDLIFQGGTSLHLSHGSPRFSEDLDFLVKSSVHVGNLNQHIEAQLKHLPWIPPEGTLTVTPSKPNKNPYSFQVVIGGKNLMPSVKVRAKLWKTPDQVMNPLDVDVSIVQAATGLAAGIKILVPSAAQNEIYADKVFALAARSYLKPRDVFDLYWLAERGHTRCTRESLEMRLATYPTKTPAGWLDQAFKRRNDLPEQVSFIETNLKKWLPSIYPLDVPLMVKAAVTALEDGIDRMREILDAAPSHDAEVS